MSHHFLSILLTLTSLQVQAQYLAKPVKVLVVTAHPDDESLLAATIYKITHQQGGIADQVVITNGEGGYRYSLLAASFYNLNLTDEDIARQNLPRIRKQELINAGKVLGLRNIYFLDQKDSHFGLDVKEPLDTIWNVNWIETRLEELMALNNYDFVFCLLPDSATHAHHQAATILALTTVSKLIKKPVILAVSTSNKSDTLPIKYTQLSKYPLTRVAGGKPSFFTDRTVTFGFKNKLNYKIIVNWEIAEHKSQGTLQTYMNDGDFENFWFFDSNEHADYKKVENLFDKLNTRSDPF